VTGWLTPTRAFGLALAIFGVDQITKAVMLGVFDALTNCPPPPALWLNPMACDIEVLPFWRWTMVWNRGVSMGMFTADTELGRWLLTGVTAAIAVFVALWLRKEADRVQMLALALVLGGAVGNIVDRVRFGAVADFVHLHAFGVSFYVFNVADAAITIGVIVLLIRAFWAPKPEADARQET
jgi:signal peptidase II